MITDQDAPRTGRVWPPYGVALRLPNDLQNPADLGGSYDAWQFRGDCGGV